MHMTRLRMAKGRSVHGVEEENEDVFLSFTSLSQSIKSGVLHLNFFFVTSARNSKRTSG